MLSMENKLNIYFDTNALEKRFWSNFLSLSKIETSDLFNKTVNLIKDSGIENDVNICIPEIVISEMKSHLITMYKSEKQSFEEKVKQVRAIFGNIIEVGFEFKITNENDFEEYINDLFDDFLSNPRYKITIVSFPRDEIVFENIVDNALKTVRPFTKVTKGGKTYTDAGFKDTVIFESVIRHNKDKGIFVSADGDFFELFNKEKDRCGNLVLCKNIGEVQSYIYDNLDVFNEEKIKSIICFDEYTSDRIINECDLDIKLSRELIQIIDYSKKENVASMEYIMMVGYIKYIFNVEIDLYANEIIMATCEEFFDEGSEE